MILYFTGTGNSMDAALRLREDESEVLIRMDDCVRRKDFMIPNTEGERIGFVFPVYFGGLPSLVHYFLSHVRFAAAPGYVYIAATCGEKMYAAGKMAAQLLEEKAAVDAIFQVPMPDNYILLYRPEDPEEQERRLKEAHEHLKELREKILNGQRLRADENAGEEKLGFFMYSLYKPAKNIRFFHVDDTCVGCGLCEKRCPAGVIRMQDHKPVWTKNTCIQCLSCMRCGAIQFGPFTRGRKRYHNPVLD